MHTIPTTRTSQELYTSIYQAILPAIQDSRECQAITQRLLAYAFNCDQAAIIGNKTLTLTPDTIQQLEASIKRIKQHEPIQYIVGEAPFMGRDFQVTPAVLIPRPETEELVMAILQENKRPGLSVLDIGTGSGCIAITLKKAWPTAQVHALDISQPALAIAAANANRWKAAINWLQVDILQDVLPKKRWDILVSNPPYVRFQEKKWMHQRVLDHEPSQALFVPDHNPRLFYTRIIMLATKHLKPAGKIYLEINEAFGNKIAQQLQVAGFEGIGIQQDMQGKDRWISASLPCA